MENTEIRGIRKEKRILTASDIHYLAPSLTDLGESYFRQVLSVDAKMTEASPQIFSAFLKEAVRQGAAALILTGDLTFNGERISLEEVCQKLLSVQERGISVFVLPGNHDIANQKAFCYRKDAVYPAESVSQKDFRRLCAAFGPEKAIAADEHSFSYLAEIVPGLFLLALDGNTEDAPGRIKAETLTWADTQLAAVRRREGTIISASHQSVLPQHIEIGEHFCLENHREVRDLLQKYQVRINLSGHVHMQHTAQEAGLRDIATGGLTVGAQRFGVLVAAGAASAEKGLEQSEKTALRYFFSSVRYGRKEAQARFNQQTEKQVRRTLMTTESTNSGLIETDRRQMTEFAVEMNFRYFSGSLDQKWLAQHKDAFSLWQTAGEGSFWQKYFQSIAAEINGTKMK